MATFFGLGFVTDLKCCRGNILSRVTHYGKLSKKEKEVKTLMALAIPTKIAWISFYAFASCWNLFWLSQFGLYFANHASELGMAMAGAPLRLLQVANHDDSFKVGS